jgi:carboxymethylenebutenolidase
MGPVVGALTRSCAKAKVPQAAIQRLPNRVPRTWVDAPSINLNDMKRIISSLALYFVVQSLLAQEYKDFGKDRLNHSPRHAEWVDIKLRGRTIKAFVVYPERKDKAPVVLVIQEIFGLTDWLRSLCDELAEAGVIAIAPDFLNGQKFEDADGAVKAVSALSAEQIKTVLDATSDYALTKIPAGSGTLAVCGFCRGGGWAFDYASANPKLKAVYSFYGDALDDSAKIGKIPCPVYGFYGENDERVNATIPKAEELMKAAGKKYEPVIYKEAGHGFMRSGEPANPNMREADKKARDDAWARWKMLLKQL